jgi:hypothetical protein
MNRAFQAFQIVDAGLDSEDEEEASHHQINYNRLFIMYKRINGFVTVTHQKFKWIWL